MNDMNASIKAAQEAAANMVDDAEVISETLPAVAGQTSITVNSAKPSMATMGQSTGISQMVDEWLKVDEFGLNIGSDRKKFESIVVDIDMTEDKGFFVKETIKYGNNPTVYASRFGGSLSDKGEPWVEVVARARRVEPNAVVFPSADIILHMTEPMEIGKDKEKVTLPPGTKLGLGLSRSNWQNWCSAFKDANDAGLIGQRVRFKLIAEEVSSKKNGHTWGVIRFELA